MVGAALQPGDGVPATGPVSAGDAAGDVPTTTGATADGVLSAPGGGDGVRGEQQEMYQQQLEQQQMEFSQHQEEVMVYEESSRRCTNNNWSNSRWSSLSTRRR